MPITPDSVQLDGDESIQLTNDAAAVWSTNCGALFTDAALTTPYDGVTSVASVYFEPFNRTVQGTVTAGANTASITIIGILPPFPHYPMEWKGTKRGLVVSIARSGRSRGRVLGDGEQMRDYKLIFNNRKQTETIDFEDFHNFHFPGRPFKYRNLWHGIDGMFEFDSDIDGKAQGRSRADLQVAIRQIPYAADALFATSGNAQPLDGDFLIEG
jgi:hypothetical protein